MSSETQKSAIQRYRERHRGTFRSLRRGWSRFTNHKLGLLGLFILLVMVIVAVFAPQIAPHTTEWTAPSSLSQGDGTIDSFEELANAKIVHPAPPQFGDPYFAPLGTDHAGHGVLTYLIFGTQTTLYIGFVAGLLSSLVGIPIGLISGFYGDSWIDEGIQRIIDIFYSIPFLPLVIVLVFIYGSNTTNIIIAIVIKSWLNNAIVIRGQTLSLKERSYIESAKVSGASDNRIIFRHILPNVLPLGFVYLAQDAAFAILVQANLSFLGLAGSSVSWGRMLQFVRATGHIFDALWWMIPPGILIALVAAAFYFVGYSLEDVTNPHTGGER
jgi:peptide/nickel transport system permease protein